MMEIGLSGLSRLLYGLGLRSQSIRVRSSRPLKKVSWRSNIELKWSLLKKILLFCLEEIQNKTQTQHESKLGPVLCECGLDPRVQPSTRSTHDPGSPHPLYRNVWWITRSIVLLTWSTEQISLSIGVSHDLRVSLVRSDGAVHDRSRFDGLARSPGMIGLGFGLISDDCSTMDDDRAVRMHSGVK